MCAKRVGAFLFLVLLCVCAGMLVLINLPRVATTPTPAPAIVRVTHTAAPMASAVPPPPPAASLAPSRPTCGQPITFPRPPGDNGRGVHWCPATRHSKAATDRLVSEVVSMGLKWVVLVEGIDSWDFDHALREEDAYLIWHLQSQGIMPIVRLKSEVGASDEKAFLDKARELRELGIHYFQIFNEPNRDDEWAVVGPRTPEAYMFHWLRRAKAIVALGGLPGLGSLDPATDAGGPRDDLVFLRRTLEILRQSNECDVIARTWIGVHNYVIVDFSDGYDYVSDENGFALFKAYDRLAREILGFSLPILATEGGMPADRVGDWHRDPRRTEELQAKWLCAAYQAMIRRPEYFYSFNPWVLANLLCEPKAADPRLEYGAFFDKDGAPKLVVRCLRGN